MAGVYSVSQVNSYIKNMFTQDYLLNRISVKGEISNCKYHSSGHIYFTLKDKSGTLSAVMFASQRKGLTFTLQEGQQVVVSGSVDVYERDGKYQLYAREIKRDGNGDLFERYQKLRDELEEMGMFAPEYKQEIPAYAKTIGVVTASTGAAIRDIMNITARRNPYVQLILYPAQVQGEGAKESVVRGIHALEHYGVDLMIVGRGGGSIEDLWAFNEEEVARAVFECSVPVISAVGHETDTTIIDYVADLRAPTPSAAAELAVWDYYQFQESLRSCRQKMNRIMYQRLELYHMKVEKLRTRLNYLHPETMLRERRQHIADASDRIKALMDQKLKMSRHQLELRKERLKGLSPLDKLNQGYAFAEQEADGRKGSIRSIGQVQTGDAITIYVADGRIEAEVTGVQEERYE